MVSYLLPEAETESQPSSPAETESDILVLDAHTFRDLEIFESGPGGTSLFEFCNLTRTNGGAKALRRRMEQPSSNATRISATQASLSFIIAHRRAFDTLASLAYSSGRVARYSHEALPVVTQGNTLEFGLSALELRINNDRDYNRILHGVQVTCLMIRTLRRFAGNPDLASPVGEVAPVFEEMHTLLALPGLSRVPDREIGSGLWKILRMDQVFRVHEKAAIARLLQLIFEMDALVTMADVTYQNRLVLPDIEEGELRVHAEGLVHPLVHNAVANPAKLDQQRRVLFLTGPNMAGKTTYLRAFATSLYLAHLGMGVPAKRFAFVPAQRLFSSISLNDDLPGGISYFRAEALRVKAIARAVADGYRVVAVMDEPFKGTNVKDAFDASLAILKRFAPREDCLFMFSSHLIELSEQLGAVGQVDCRYFEAEESEGRLHFEYLLRPGVSNQRLGMRVLSEEGIFDLLDENPGAK